MRPGGDAFGSLMLFGFVALMFLFVVAVVLSLLWAYRDAERRGKSGCVWSLIIAFTWPFGLIAYLLLRDQEVKL